MRSLTSGWKERLVWVDSTYMYYGRNLHKPDPTSKDLGGKIPLRAISDCQKLNVDTMRQRGCPDSSVGGGFLVTANRTEFVFACASAATRDLWLRWVTLKRDQLRERGDDFDEMEDADAMILEDEAPTMRRFDSFDEPGDLTGSALETTQDVYAAVAADRMRRQQIESFALQPAPNDDGLDFSDEDEEDELEVEQANGELIAAADAPASPIHPGKGGGFAGAGAAASSGAARTGANQLTQQLPQPIKMSAEARANRAVGSVFEQWAQQRGVQDARDARRTQAQWGAANVYARAASCAEMPVGAAGRLMVLACAVACPPSMHADNEGCTGFSFQFDAFETPMLQCPPV
jgi:hypothetical protein